MSKELEQQQAEFARKQLEAEDRVRQSEFDRAEIKVKLIDNGVLVKTGNSWLAFDQWERAAVFIGERLKTLDKKRKESAR